jgi:acyl carrier protein
MNDFIRAFEETLDLPPGSVTPATDFKSLADWDSLAQLSVMTIIEDMYRKVIDPSLFKRCATIGDLLAAVETA